MATDRGAAPERASAHGGRCSCCGRPAGVMLDLRGYGWMLWQGLELTILVGLGAMTLALVLGLPPISGPALKLEFGAG